MGKLAKLSKTPVPTVSRVEAGKLTPPMGAVEKWARVFLLHGDEKQRFLVAAQRAKVTKHHTIAYIERNEKIRDEAIELLESVVRLCIDKGMQFPQEFTKRLEALRGLL